MRAGRQALRGAALGFAAALSGVAAVHAAPGGATSTPNDPGFVHHQQWGLVQAGFPTAWCRTTGVNTLIVVIDTGIDAAHPDLAGKLIGEARVQNGVITTGSGTAADDSGHGTHVSGIAAADTGNGIGIAGAAPDAKLFAIKVLFAPSPGQPEQGSQSDLVQAIDYATDTVAPTWPGPVVLNISIGAADDTSGSSSGGSGSVSDNGGDISTALAHAYNQGLGIALAAGNTGTSPIGSQAVQDGQALSVGALDQNGAVAPYSPTQGVSVFAAGGAAGADHRYTGTGILSTWPHSSAGDYAWMAGTSMAAPHVAAALALLMSTGLSNADAYSRLEQSEDAQKRLHIDVALGSTTPCGTAATAPAHAVGATPPRTVAPAVTRAAPPVAVASAPPAPVARAAAAKVVVATTHVVTPASSPVRPLSAQGSAAWGRGTLVGLALIMLWMLVPRRLLPAWMQG